MDIEKLRRETSGCLEVVHLNNAGAALMPDEVQDAIVSHLKLEGRIGGYEAAESQADSIAAFYPAVADLIGAKPSNIAFTSSATNSFARALSSIPFREGDYVLIASEDYISNQLAFLALSQRIGIRLLRAPMMPDGGVDLDVFREMALRHRPRLVSMTHVPTNSGLIQPVEEVGKICRELDILFLLDACQSVGQLPLDVAQLHCDFLSATFRKFLRGPRGAGFLFVSDRILEEGYLPLFIDMQAAQWVDENRFELSPTARRFEDWEMPYALIQGSKIAAGYASALGVENMAAHNRILTEHLHNALHTIGLPTYDPKGRRCAIVTTTVPHMKPADVLAALRHRKVNASISYRKYAIPDMDRKGIPWALRLSPHYYNTTGDIDFAVECLWEMIKK